MKKQEKEKEVTPEINKFAVIITKMFAISMGTIFYYFAMMFLPRYLPSMDTLIKDHNF